MILHSYIMPSFHRRFVLMSARALGVASAASLSKQHFFLLLERLLEWALTQLALNLSASAFLLALGKTPGVRFDAVGFDLVRFDAILSSAAAGAGMSFDAAGLS